MFENASYLNLISAIGLFAMLALAWLMSSHKSKVDWRLVSIGVLLQIVLAAVFFNSQSWTFDRQFTRLDSVVEACQAGLEPTAIPDSETGVKFAPLFDQLTSNEITAEELKSQYSIGTEGVSVPRFQNGVVFYCVESFFSVIKRSVDAGASFVFNVNGNPDYDPEMSTTALLHSFAFGILPTVVFFAALMSVLYYIGLMQKLIRAMAWVMQKTLRTSPSESLAAAANVLVGHTEAPLVVKPYVANMTRSELNALMVGGFSTISGSLMAVFAGMGVSAGHLLTASLISAPAALVLAKIMQPETETPVPLQDSEKAIEHSASNVIEAAANGATEGMKLAINIAAMLIAFLALIMFIDILLQGVGGWISVDLSLSRIFGVVFYPLAWIMGIESKDCLVAGDLLGKKMVVNEFLSYIELSGQSEISDRTRTIMIYALCGFSNFGAIGIQIGGIGPLAPERKGDLAQLGLRAMFGGMLAACMTACIAGMLYGILR
ncbi:MAG: CNT family concentrative nucleoside transporter [Mariniblastus sp.]|jgi:CNT family concentrative nucleoside transporter